MLNINDIVKVTKVIDGKTSIQFEIGRIIYIGRRALIEFQKNICGHNGNSIGKNRCCWMCDFDAIQKI